MKIVANLPVEVREAFERVLAERKSLFGDHYFASYYHSKVGAETVVYMSFFRYHQSRCQRVTQSLLPMWLFTYESLLCCAGNRGDPAFDYFYSG